MHTPDPTPRIICTDASLGALLRDWLDSQAAAANVICSAHDCSQAPLCRWLEDVPLGQEGRVQAALLDAVSTLIRTRHAFKSRELADLRRRLEQLLEELSAHDQ
jgi:hypothetical protein